MRYDLVEDIRNSPEIMAKIRAEDRRYAQNLYAAWCNMQWCKRTTWPILAEEYWHCSWRSAGGIVADLRGVGEDYMDWYCSGIGDGLGNGDADGVKSYVSESVVTEEIEQDFTLDLVIANAGISAGTSKGTESFEQVNEIFATNLNGVLNIIHPAIDQMLMR